MSLHLRLTQRQRLVLTPTMRKTLEMLRLPGVEMDQAVARELLENPFLVRAAPVPKQSGAAQPDDVAATPLLLEQLHRQIGLMHLDPDVRAMAEYLAAELRDDGYLDVPLPEIATDIGAPLAVIEAGLDALQRCDPPGIGARGLAECLALQLMDRADLPRALAEAAVARLEDFAAGKPCAVALGIDDVVAARIAAVMPHLAAQPVSDVIAPAQVLCADLIARRDSGGIVSVELARASVPRLRLDQGLCQTVDDTETTTELRARAEAMIAALNFRAETLLRIGRHIAEVQHAVFSGRTDAIRPLSRREVAATLGLHPSTVGRAVASKAIKVEGRLRPLSDFFSSALPGADGAAVSAYVVRHRIVALVAAEPPGAPLSDARLCAMLHAEGVDIARRTVTKYRQWMRLPSSSGRRRIAMNRRLRAGQASIPKE
jgi:RNA polymerase sigma-54 factor